MHIPKSYFSEYFKKSVLHLGKSKFIFFILTSIELIELTTNLIDKITVLFRHNKVFNYKVSKLSTIVLTISPYHHFFHYMKQNIAGDFSINRLMLVIIAGLYVLFFIFFLNINKEDSSGNENNQNIYTIYLEIFVINFFDYFLYRLLPFYTLDVYSREVVLLCSKSSHSTIDIIVIFICLAFLVLVSLFHIIYYNQICSWSNFKVIDSCLKYYPYDQYFSSKFDTVCYILKLLITLNQNYLFCHGDYVDYISLFTSFATIILFFSFFLYIAILIICSSNIMFFYLSFFNKVRIFYMLLIAESCAFRIILNEYEDYVPFLIYEILLIILNCYIIIQGFEPFVLARVINNQNFLGVCWFIQGNDIDIQHFTAEWITYHKTQCVDSFCLICIEMSDENKDYFSEYCLNENKAMTSRNILRQNSLINKKNEKKKQINSNKNLINKIFPPFKFSQALLKMAERTKKFMSKNDLIRLDFLHIMVLFLSEVSIEFHLFSELCKLIMKYSENTNVFVSLLLVFEIIRKSNLNIIKGYDLIKKNEDLRNALNVYIKKYENFIRYGDKSPSNYIFISKEFFKFKELVKDIHVLFKKNIECNYQLLLMRYAYENLLHLQFKNTQPFDLNYYSDFLDFHFLNDKIILMKYFIQHDYFQIIKGSKELLKYQGKQFSKIFPDDFQNIAICKFKEQLINQDQKDIKPFYEFFVKNLNNSQSFGFIESFKMKYLIYPTDTVNELFIQGNFVNNYSTLMVFQLYDNEEYLYSFSPQLYKIIGLTPSMTYSLKKSGINISFNNLFSNKNISKYEQEKNIYKFQYSRYYPFYQMLIASDTLKDNHNFNQLKDKINEISNMANEKKEILFLITKKFEISLINYKYIIYSMKEQKRKKRGEKSIARDYSALKLNNDLSGSRSDDSNDENEGEDNEFDEQFEGKGINLGASTLSSASLSGSAQSTRSSLQRGKKGGKGDEKHKRSEELKRYTIIILTFGAFLIMITILFLVLETRQNNNFMSLFNLFETFKLFKRGVESSPLSLLSNYRYYDTENKNGTNVYELYANEISAYDDTFTKLPIHLLIQAEIKSKYGKIMLAFDDYKKSMFKLGSKISGQISALNGFSYSFIEENNKLRFIKQRTNLIDLIRQYNNIIVTLLENNAYSQEIFSLINMGPPDGNSRSIYLQDDALDVNQNTKDMLLLLLMYPFMHDGLKDTSHLIEKLFDDSLSTIEKYLIFFFTVLLIFHSMLVVICIIFLISYIKMMKINIFSSNQLFSDKKFLDMQNKRLEQIKIMNNLYSEHPLKIAERIDIIDDLYKRKTREDNSSNKNTYKPLNDAYGNDDRSPPDDRSKNSEDISKNSVKSKKKFQSEDLFLKKSSLKGLKSLHSLHDNTHKLTTKTTNTNNIEQLASPSINYDGIVSKNVKISDNQFKKVINKEIYILCFTFGIYFLFNIIFFIFVFKAKNKMNILIDYCDANNSIDGYLFDNINSILYLYITNSTSTFYSQLVYEDNNLDYVQDGIDNLYSIIKRKDLIESDYSNLFPRVGDIINLNCSEYVPSDDYFMATFEELNLNFSYQDYYSALCKIFPVATTGSDTNMFMEILFNCEVMYHRYEPNDSFDDIFKLYIKKNNLFSLYTFVLTLSRIIRTYFNEKIFSNEVKNIFDSFSYIFIIYLVLCVFLEIVIFFILNFGIISDVRRTNKLLLDFMSSLKF